jgi:hypothetical protein
MPLAIAYLEFEFDSDGYACYCKNDVHKELEDLLKEKPHLQHIKCMILDTDYMSVNKMNQLNEKYNPAVIYGSYNSAREEYRDVKIVVNDSDVYELVQKMQYLRSKTAVFNETNATKVMDYLQMLDEHSIRSINWYDIDGNIVMDVQVFNEPDDPDPYY